MGSGHRWRGRESLVVPSKDPGSRRTNVCPLVETLLQMVQSWKFLLRLSKVRVGAAGNPAIKTPAESLVQFNNFCAADQAYDFAQTIIDRETAVAPQEVPFNSFP